MISLFPYMMILEQQKQNIFSTLDVLPKLKIGLVWSKCWVPFPLYIKPEWTKFNADLFIVLRKHT